MPNPARHYLFTSWQVDLTPTFDDHVIYAIYQKERCPTTGRLHWQGYVELDQPQRYPATQKSIGLPEAHLITARTRVEAREYCRKEETRISPSVEFGIWREHAQGDRSDLHAVSDAIHAGATIRDIAVEHTVVFMRTSRGISHAHALIIQAPARHPCRVLHLCGPTGVGKSWFATSNFPGCYVWSQPLGAYPYALGYAGEEVIILDDYRPKFLSLAFMLRLLDVYPLMLNVQGDNVACMAKTFVITSNFSMETWYPEEDDLSPLVRRISGNPGCASIDVSAAGSIAHIRAMVLDSDFGDLVLEEPSTPPNSLDSSGADDSSDLSEFENE